MKEYVIEKGLPIGADRTNRGKLTTTCAKMEVGDSFLFSSLTRSRAHAAVHHASKVTGFKSTTCAQSGDVYRVWRVA